MILDYLKDLVHYQEWADAKFFSRWTQLAEIPEREEVQKLADHFVMVQSLFIHAIEHQDVARPAEGRPLRSVSELKAQCRENHHRLFRYLAGAREKDPSSNVTLPWFRSDHPLTVLDALLQVVLHTQHHRAQVLQSLARHADKRMIIDYISWVYQGKPAAAWD